MHNVEERLIQSFLIVFPSLDREQVPGASITAVPEWDSIASINLLAVLEEEFAISVNPDDLPKLVSFASILEYVEAKQVSA
jgi:acyl carrier protein